MTSQEGHFSTSGLFQGQDPRTARSNTGFQCHVHREWVSFDWHHVHPTQYHGPDTQENLIKVCPNAHRDIHHLMEAMLRGKSYNLRQYGPSVRRYALQGYEEVIAYAEGIARDLDSR